MEEPHLLKEIFDVMTGHHIGEKITLIIFACVLIKRMVRAEFRLINNTLGVLTKSVTDLTTALRTLEMGHSTRLALLERDVQDLKTIALGGLNGTSTANKGL